MLSWRDLRRFCQRDGWELIKDTDHYYYSKDSENGKPKTTRVSKGTGEIPKSLWQKILKQQLQVSKEYFNSKI